MAQGPGGIKFGEARAALARVSHNGICVGDERVQDRTNEAMEVLLGKGIWVNTMATYDVVASGTLLLLPKELENAIEVEVLSSATVNNQTDVTQGHYDLVNQFTYVDPSTAHDNPLVDLFLKPDPDDSSILRRQYDYPGLQANATVRVTGAKRYVPITSDNDFLIIQNVPALKLGILYLELLEKNEPDMAEKYLNMAVDRLSSEVKKHQLDPRNSLKRKADYQADLINYVEGTLGKTRARLALELPGFLLKGKAEISYMVNRAVQMLVDNRNQLAIAGRISVKGGVTELVYAPATAPDTELAWNDYNQIRLMVQSFITESGDGAALQVAEEYQRKAFELQRSQLIEQTELLRHTTYTTALSAYVPGSFGWAVARLALEMPGGLALTTTELERTLSMAEMRLMERGIWKGCLLTLSATITGGDILFPRNVEAVLAADICGMPTDIRSIFFEFQKNGPGKGNYCGCSGMFTDMGEVWATNIGSRRRKYHYHGSTTDETQLTAVCKVRWEQKESCDELTIKNIEALRYMTQAIQAEKKEDWTAAGLNQGMAIEVLERELREYLGGVQHTLNVDMAGFGMGDLGEPL